MNKANKENVHHSVQTFLCCGNDFGLMKQSVDKMYAIFQSNSEVNADDQSDAHIIIPSGKAISPSMSAHCLLEMKRTALFLRRIHEAIDHKVKQQGNSSIHILYAGTGPYVTLITPLLSLFNPSEIEVDLLDINSVSLNSAVKVLCALEPEQFIGSVYLADAVVFHVDKKYNMVISETMQAALKKEPQVAIMQNLIPQCSNNVVFIHQEIKVNAEFVSPGNWNPETYIMENVQHLPLTEVITLNKENLNIAKMDALLPTVEKIMLQLLNNTKLVVEQGKAMDYSHAVFEEIHNGCVSDWRNPYLCI